MARPTSSALLLLSLCYVCASLIDVCQAVNPLKMELLRKDKSDWEDKVGRALAAASKKLEQSLSGIHKLPSFEDHMKVCKDMFPYLLLHAHSPRRPYYLQSVGVSGSRLVIFLC